jgi:hypothetical protein
MIYEKSSAPQRLSGRKSLFRAETLRKNAKYALFQYENFLHIIGGYVFSHL